jgi:hypothetical protein
MMIPSQTVSRIYQRCGRALPRTWGYMMPSRTAFATASPWLLTCNFV